MHPNDSLDLLDLNNTRLDDEFPSQTTMGSYQTGEEIVIAMVYSGKWTSPMVRE